MMKKSKGRRSAPHRASTAALVLLMLIFLFPFYIMLVGAFKNQMALTLVPPDINPLRNLTANNLRYVFQKSGILTWLLNSLLVSGGAAMLTILVSATAGYSFAKKKYRGRDALFGVVISTMLLPRQMLLIPNYLVAMNLGLTNRLYGLVLTSVSPAFGIFLCRQFMQGIPTELTEAADMDGCGEIRKFVRIILPLSAPALGALAIFSFFGTWNDYLWQLILIGERDLYTVPIGVATFSQGQVSNTGRQLMAAAVATLPMLALFLLCQKAFVRGITLGGVKG